MPVKLDDKVSVSGQITPGDIVLLKKEGFTHFMCNRPDGEDPGQPAYESIKTVAQAQGCTIEFLPVGAEGITMDTVGAFRQFMDKADGPMLAYCRSGMRCCTLWALASAIDQPPAKILKAAQDAGYSLHQLAGMLDTLHSLGHIPSTD